MSTIKFNELATKSTLLLTDLLAVSDSNGTLYKEDLQTFANFFSTASGLDFRGSLTIADTPNLDGWYFASESGTYTNAGSLVVSLTDNLVIIIVDDTQTTFDKVDIPLSTPNLLTTFNKTDNVNGATMKAIYDGLRATAIEENNDDYASSGQVFDLTRKDATPTLGSTKLVESGGVELSLREKLTVEIQKNKYNKTYITANTRISVGTPNLTADVNYKTSDFIKLKAETNYKFNGTITFSQFYDLEKNVGTNPGTNITSFTTPADASGFVLYRFSALNATMDGNLQLEEGTVSTSFEEFKRQAKASDIKDFSDEVETAVLGKGYIKPVVGKNRYNYKTNTLESRVNNDSGAIVSAPGYQASDWIYVGDLDNIYIKNLVWFAFYREKDVTTRVSGGVSINSNAVPADANYFRFSAIDANMILTGRNQVESGTVATDYEYFKEAFNTEVLRLEKEPTIVNVSSTTSNKAIQDAIDLIVDATPDNKYKIIADGNFIAKVTSDYKNINATKNAFIIGKDYVDVELTEGSFIYCELADNLSITYSSYEAVNFECTANFKGVVFCKNVRYPFHIDGAGSNPNAITTLKDVVVKHFGNTGNALSWLSWNPIGLGTSSGQELTMKNGEYASVSTHNNFDFEKASIVTYEDCDIIGRGDVYSNTNDSAYQPLIVATSFGSQQKDKLILKNCNISADGVVQITTGNFSPLLESQKADRVEVEVEIKNNYPLPVDNNSVDGFGLKITSKSTGSSSTVRFDETSSAFELLISNNLHDVEYPNRYLNNVVNGYQFKDGGNALKGYAIGAFDVGEGTVAVPAIHITSLGKRLGDCSTVNKTLTVIIDNTSYNIVFDKNYNGTANNSPANYTNAQIIAEIETVIGTVADVELYAVGKDYYPKFKGVSVRTNNDTSEILAGMGLVFTGFGTVRKALNSDGRIDAVALDDCAVGQKCRIIKKGQLYSDNTNRRFRIKETTQATRNAGDRFGISSTAGVFEKDATPTLLRCQFQNILEIL